MKTCPTCRRSYADDSLLYCLEDGSQLFTPPPFDRGAQETLRIPGARDTEPPATEILPHGYQPPVDAGSATWPAQNPVAAPPTMPAAGGGGTAPPPIPDPRFSNPQPTPRPARSSGPWIAVSVVLGVVVVGLIVAVAAVLIYNNAGTPNANGSANNNSSTNSNSVIIGNDNNPYPNNNSANANSGDSSSTNANTVTNVNSGPASDWKWLVGTWTGNGRQLDGGTWSVNFNSTGDTHVIRYPSLDCGGRWEEVSISSRVATFTEVIVYGKNCVSGGKITVMKVSDTQIACSWTYAGTDAEIATATLSKQ